jgi:hypothetical protein
MADLYIVEIIGGGRPARRMEGIFNRRQAETFVNSFNAGSVGTDIKAVAKELSEDVLGQGLPWSRATEAG